MLVMVLRYVVAKTYAVGRVKILSMISLFIGLVASFALTLVANFEVAYIE